MQRRDEPVLLQQALSAATLRVARPAHQSRRTRHCEESGQVLESVNAVRISCGHGNCARLIRTLLGSACKNSRKWRVPYRLDGRIIGLSLFQSQYSVGVIRLGILDLLKLHLQVVQVLRR